MAIIKKGKYIRMAPTTDELLKKLCKKFNDSESNVIKKAIEDLARKEKVQKSSP
jgi:predicted DNA-binding protein